MRFRHWLQNVLREEQEINKLKMFVDSQGLIFFFKKGKEYFGAGEDSRVVFAKMKNPDDDLPDGWGDEANFSATNLSKMVKGEPTTHIFSKSDLKKIKVVDREKVLDELEDTEGNATPKSGSIRIISFSSLLNGIRKDRDAAPNFSRADEE
jgi:hypothetical protein